MLALPGLVLLVLLALWHIATSCFQIPAYLLPGPGDLFSAAQRVQKGFPHHLAITAAESLAGFILGCCGAFLMALFFARYDLLRLSLMPYIVALKTIPIVAIAPLLVIWFGAGILPKVILSALICFFPVLVNTAKGLREVDPARVDLFRSLAASDWQVFKWLRFPNCLVYLFPAMRVSIVFAVIGSIVAEFASANSGLGFMIMMASFHVDTSAMFVYIGACALLSLILYCLVGALERIAVPWSFSERSRGDQ